MGGGFTRRAPKFGVLSWLDGHLDARHGETDEDNLLVVGPPRDAPAQASACCVRCPEIDQMPSVLVEPLQGLPGAA